MATNQLTRSRWAAFGAAVAVTLGGGITLVAQAADSGTPSSYTPITPCRLMDTRPAPFTVGPRSTPLGQGENHSVLVHGTNGNCTIPANATGIATNTTITNGTAASFLTLFPGDANRPNASNLNWVANQSPTPNQVTVGLSPDGRVRVYNDQGTVNVIIDIVGIYTPAGGAAPAAVTMVPFEVRMTFESTRTIAENGPLILSLSCLRTDPENPVVSERSWATLRARAFSQTAQYLTTSQNAVGPYPANTGVTIERALGSSTDGVPVQTSFITRQSGAAAMTALDGRQIAFSGESIQVAFNTNGADCYARGFVTLLPPA